MKLARMLGGGRRGERARARSPGARSTPRSSRPRCALRSDGVRHPRDVPAGDVPARRPLSSSDGLPAALPARCASGRSRSPTASSRRRTRRRSSRTGCRPTTSSPTTRRAQPGGAGLICIEATAVHPSGLLTGHTIAGYDPRVVDAPGARRGRGAPGRHAPLRAALPRWPRADRPPAARARRGALGGSQPALQGRAARAQRGRDRGDHRAPRARRRQRARCRARRHRAVRFARLPADAVPERALEPPRRRLGRRRRATPALRARGAAGDAARRRAGARGGHPALGRRDAAGRPARARDGGDPAHARRRRPDRLRERRDRRLRELPRLGLDRAAAAGRA